MRSRRTRAVVDGRGTRSAGWMYRLIVESLLGLRLEVDKLHVAPCLPADWKAFKVHYRYRETVYHIDVLQMAEEKGGASVTVDGVERHDKVNFHLLTTARNTGSR